MPKKVFSLFILISGILIALLSFFRIFSPNNLREKNNILGYKNFIAQSTCTEPSGGCGEGYYWDSYYCSCRSYCSPPSSGCGDNYYWDFPSCMCKPSTNPCQPPSSGCPVNYSWDYNSCSCYLPPSTCQPPANGCGDTGWYWDYAACACVYTATQAGTCVTPTGGCPSGYIWNSSNCSCSLTSIPSPTSSVSNCQPPSTGCGTDKYWDSNSCTCKTYCYPPSAGCGSNSYWDSYSCTCKSYTSTCYPPSSGCGQDKYWDSYACLCKSTGNISTCYPPSTGCGYNYYWDSYSCSCRTTSSTCNPPPAGCGTNYYWDYYSCLCKPSQSAKTSCYPPASGCGYNYYWDSANCACKQSPNISSCTTPSAGCANNSYWDSLSCTCKNYYPYYQQTNFDRFAYETKEKISCIKSLLTQYEFDRLRYLIPANKHEQEEIGKLGIKVKSCFITSDTAIISPAKQISQKGPIEYENCLITSLGEKNYRDIYYGIRLPTYEEHLQYEKCFGKTPSSSIIYYSSSTQLPKETNDCLRFTLGDSYSKVKGGRQDVSYEQRESVNRCFGINPQAFDEGRVFKIPDEIKACLLGVIGEEEFFQITSTGREPNETEKKNARECFDKLNKDQANFLPPPSEQIPFLEPERDLVNVGQFTQESKTVNNAPIGGKITFQGKGPKNSTIYIYIFSEPIVVTTKTDENGDWVYELNEPLSGEKHVAYAAVKGSSGKMVRSSVFDFTVIAAEDSSVRLLEEQNLSQNQRNKFILYAIMTVSIAVVAVFALQLRKFIKTTNTKSSPKDNLNANNGEGKSDTGPGTVN